MAEDDQLIAGRYRLSNRSGAGRWGVVWRAEDEVLRRTVALKQVRLPSGVDEDTRNQAYRRVMREGRLFARLHHPNAIAVFDVVDHADQPWLVMEYLPSESLSEAVAAHGVLSPTAAAHVGHQVAAALTAAHTAGIVHRDVKPGNVLLGADGVVKVTDFGVSRAIDEATITSSGMMAGTPAYLAPEVARGAEADFRSDVYSLGSTLYAAVEGRPPFGQDENALAQLHRVGERRLHPAAARGLAGLAARARARRRPGAAPGDAPGPRRARAARRRRGRDRRVDAGRSASPRAPDAAGRRGEPRRHLGPDAGRLPGAHPCRPVPRAVRVPRDCPEQTTPATTVATPSGGARRGRAGPTARRAGGPGGARRRPPVAAAPGAARASASRSCWWRPSSPSPLLVSMRSGDGGATTAGGAAPGDCRPARHRGHRPGLRVGRRVGQRQQQRWRRHGVGAPVPGAPPSRSRSSRRSSTTTA